MLYIKIRVYNVCGPRDATGRWDAKTGDFLGDQGPANLEYTALSKRLYQNKVESKD